MYCAASAIRRNDAENIKTPVSTQFFGGVCSHLVEIVGRWQGNVDQIDETCSQNGAFPSSSSSGAFGFGSGGWFTSSRICCGTDKLYLMASRINLSRLRLCRALDFSGLADGALKPRAMPLIEQQLLELLLHLLAASMLWFVARYVLVCHAGITTASCAHGKWPSTFQSVC